MSIWKIELYDNKGDPTPSRIGYTDAPSERKAIEAAEEAMGDAARADLIKVRDMGSASLPKGKVVWEL